MGPDIDIFYEHELLLDAKLNKETTNVESPVMLYKTDYNNMADLSKFVNEYNKAQAMILECKKFYKSFLRSKLLTYSQLTDTYYKCSAYKFYTKELTSYKYTNDSILLSTVLNQYGFEKIASGMKGHYVYRNIYAPIILAASLASAEIAEKNWNNESCIYKLLLSLSEESCLRIDEIMYKQSGIIYSPYGYVRNRKKCKEFHTHKEYEDHVKKINDTIQAEWVKAVKKYLPHMLKYVGYENLVHAKITYLILDNVKSVLKNAYEAGHMREYSKSVDDAKAWKKKFDDIEKNVNDHIKDIVTFDLRAFIKEEDIIEAYANKIRSFTNLYGKHSIMPDDLEKLMNTDEYDKYVEAEINDTLTVCRQVINEYTNYDTDKLYIIDKDNNACFFCQSNEIDKDKVEIHVKDRNLVCVYENERTTHYSQFSHRSDIEKVRKILVFDIDTNEMSYYNERTSNYSEQIEYRY